MHPFVQLMHMHDVNRFSFPVTRTQNASLHKSCSSKKRVVRNQGCRLDGCKNKQLVVNSVIFQRYRDFIRGWQKILEIFMKFFPSIFHRRNHLRLYSDGFPLAGFTPDYVSPLSLISDSLSHSPSQGGLSRRLVTLSLHYFCSNTIFFPLFFPLSSTAGHLEGSVLNS